MTPNADRHPVSAETVLVRTLALTSRVDDDLIFFDEQGGRYLATGRVGADIWELIESPRTLREICDELMNRYAVDEATCLAEVRAFAEELLAAGVAERC